MDYTLGSQHRLDNGVQTGKPDSILHLPDPVIHPHCGEVDQGPIGFGERVRELAVFQVGLRNAQEFCGLGNDCGRREDYRGDPKEEDRLTEGFGPQGAEGYGERVGLPYPT